MKHHLLDESWESVMRLIEVEDLHNTVVFAIPWLQWCPRINSCVTPNSLEDFDRFWRFFRYLPRNSEEPHQLSVPEPSRTSSAISTQTLGTSLAICDLISYYLHWNPPESHLLSAPEPSGTLISHLHRNPPEPHQPSALEGSGTLGTFSRTWCCSCTGSHQSYSGLKTP